MNSYRPPVGTLRGLLAAGDAVCTTCPTGGRGLSLAMMSAARLVDVVASEPEATRADRLNAWCEDALSPWVADHMRWEDTVHARWAGRPLDPEAPVCAELLMAALADRPELGPQIGPYLAMLVGPRRHGPGPRRGPGDAARRLATGSTERCHPRRACCGRPTGHSGRRVTSF